LRPVWLVLQSGPTANAIVAVADDRAAASGAPLYYRAGDSLAYPTIQPFLELSEFAVRPGAAEHVIAPGATGIPLGSSFQRGVLAWAMQAPALLGTISEGAKIGWRLQPVDRLAHLAPFANWSLARAAIVDGRLVWLSDGYLSTSTFPLTEPVQWRGGWSSSVTAGFVGTVDAASGDAHIYLRPGGGPMAESWGAIAAGVVEDAASIPAAVADAESYPAELFRVQTIALERAEWGPGGVAARPASTPVDAAAPQEGWRSDGRGVALLAAFDRGSARRVSAVLEGTVVHGRQRLELVQLDSAATLPTPANLSVRWSRFPTYEQLRDSVTGAGSRLEAGPVRLWLASDGVGAMDTYVAVRQAARPVVAWIAVASADRAGAGRSLSGAWDNLRGEAGPLPPGATGGTFTEAQRWLRVADAALRRGDWAAFGRAFDALRQALDVHADSLSQ
jgi:uncharacterized protein